MFKVRRGYIQVPENVDDNFDSIVIYTVRQTTRTQRDDRHQAH
jgi:hypothetical protein